MSAFEVGAYDQGAHVTYLGPGGSQIGYKESIKDTARVLGRMFDGIEYRGAAQANVEILGEHAGVPVWNGLTDEWHPTQMLADMLTMRDHADRPLDSCPTATWATAATTRRTRSSSRALCSAWTSGSPRLNHSGRPRTSSRLHEGLASQSGARITVTADVPRAVSDADFLYTDVWLSMGEPTEQWDARIDELLPYQVN